MTPKYEWYELTHKKCVELCSSWLSNRCGFVVDECNAYEQEIPDVIGFNHGNTYLIEVKISTADFLRDMKKPFRINEHLGMGNYRYFACPEGLLRADHLPPGWGLINVTYSGDLTIEVAANRKSANREAEMNMLLAGARRAARRGDFEPRSQSDASVI